MQKIFLLLTILLPALTFASIEGKTHLVLLTAVGQQEGKAFYNGSNYDSNRRIENKVRKSFDPSHFYIEVKHKASLKEVWTSLQDSTVDGVIFVGHGSEENSKSLISNAAIVDHDLTDLKYAFTNVHSNLKFLAVVSCFSETIISEFKKKSFYRNAQALKILSFPGKVSAMKGLTIAIERAHEIFQENSVINIQAAPFGYKLSIQRNNHEKIPVLLISEGRALSFFPGETDAEIGSLFLDDLQGEVSIIVDSGQTVLKKKINLGDFDVFSTNQDINCTLTPEKNKSGQKLGVSQNFYKLKCE